MAQSRASAASEPRDGGLVVRGEADVRDRDHAHARIATGRAVGAQLFEVAERDRLAEARDQDAGLLLQLAAGGAVEVVVGLDEAAGQGPAPPERMAPALDQQHRESARPHREQHDVDRDRDRRIPPRVVVRQELGFVGHGVRLLLALRIGTGAAATQRNVPNERLIGCRAMADQRDRILDATLALMARGGAHGTSMRAVAAACGP